MLAALRRPSLFLITALWAGLLSASVTGFDLVPVVGLQIAVVAGLCLAKSWRVHFTLLTASFFWLGVLRSPEATWNTVAVPGEISEAATFPVIAHIEVPRLLGECTEQVRARVSRVLVGYPSLTGRHVVLRGLERAGWPDTNRFTVIGRFRLPRRRLNPHTVDRREQHLRKGVVGEIDVEGIGHDDTAASPTGVAALRDRLASLIRDASDDETGGMLEALLLGKRANLSPSLEALMVKAGTYHVLAISGLHVGIVVLLVSSLLSILGLGRGTRITLVVLCVLFYVIVTGARPSAQRAWTFFTLVSLCKLLQWKVDYPNCVCAAGTLLLLAFPYLAWDLGFKLSLGAVLGITLLVPQITGAGSTNASGFGRLIKGVKVGLAASFSAQLFTLPIVLQSFGRVSLLGPLANLIALPLVTLVVAAGLEASIAMPFCHSLARVFIRSASTLAGILISSTALLTRLVNPLVFTGRPSILRSVIYSGALAYLALARPRMACRRKVILLVLLSAFIIIPFPKDSTRPLEVTFLYVGDGDAAVVSLPDGRTLVVDAGGRSDTFDAARTHILPFLRARGTRTIDTAVITHSHNDHYGGFMSLMESMKVCEFLVGSAHGEGPYEALLETARRRGIEVTPVRGGDMRFYGDVVLEVYHPTASDIGWDAQDPNAQSVVFKLTYQDLSLLFTGDVTPDVQRRLVEDCDNLACDVLKVPHHGAPCALDTGFVRALGCKIGVISVGTRFSSHPSAGTIRLLEASGIRPLTTIWDGAVSVVSDGESTTVRCEVAGKRPVGRF